MTQEIYNGILDRCNEIGFDVEPLFLHMLTKYQDFMSVYVDRIEEVKGVELTEISEEKWKLNRQKLYARIRAKYGEDTI